MNKQCLTAPRPYTLNQDDFCSVFEQGVRSYIAPFAALHPSKKTNKHFYEIVFARNEEENELAARQRFNHVRYDLDDLTCHVMAACCSIRARPAALMA